MSPLLRLAPRANPIGIPGHHIDKHFVVQLTQLEYRFHSHFHPFASDLVSRLLAGGLVALEDADTAEPEMFRDFFEAGYRPQLDRSKGAYVVAPFPAERLDFEANAAYATYNWELFFHVPLLIAVNLSKNQRYAEAQQWFHYIFDPTAGGSDLDVRRYWNVKPFKAEDRPKPLGDVLAEMSPETQRSISDWRANPFRAHRIARERPVAYMYKTVMSYLDNLIAWGDSLFRQDTTESVNEALQIYVLAASILGPEPQAVPAPQPPKAETYASLQPHLDAFSNALRDVEGEIPFEPIVSVQPGAPPPQAQYFCAPRNEKLASYWSAVGERLFNIRNSRNIDGVFRTLPVFAPPIDPGVLARAVAAGVDIAALVAGTEAPLSPVRFPAVLQRALEMCSEVKALGGQILAAMEKHDGEALGLLRAQHESTLLALGKSIRYSQWQEAIKAREALQMSLDGPLQRFSYYERLLGRVPEPPRLPAWEPLDRSGIDRLAFASSEPALARRAVPVDIDPAFSEGGRKVSRTESHELQLMADAQTAQDVAGALDTIGGFVALIPNIGLNVMPFGLGADASFGGSNLAELFRALATAARMVGSRIGYEANRAGRMAGLERREQDWALQSVLAAVEVSQLYKQVRAAELREEIAKREHANFQTQIAQAIEVEEFLSNEKRKQTTTDLYLWMKREAKGLYAQYFQFAYDLGKKAERALKHELGHDDSPTLGTAYLAGREGLFAGEKLYLDLKRLEVSYQDLARRELELTKHVSLREWFPAKYLELCSKGETSFELPESLFDLDCPDHEFRRIKTVALSLPCITGPYANVHCRLSLSNSMVRRPNGELGSDSGAVESVITSVPMNDAGMFEVNLRDERYLPFELRGPIGTWTLALLGDPRPFDYSSIADAVLTIRYTARPGPRRNARPWLAANATTSISVPQEFPSEWARFKTTALKHGQKATLKLSLDERHHAFRLRELGDAKTLHVICSSVPTGTLAVLGQETALAPTMSFDREPVPRIGTLSLELDTTALSDMWLILEGSV